MACKAYKPPRPGRFNISSLIWMVQSSAKIRNQTTLEATATTKESKVSQISYLPPMVNGVCDPFPGWPGRA